MQLISLIFSLGRILSEYDWNVFYRKKMFHLCNTVLVIKTRNIKKQKKWMRVSHMFHFDVKFLTNWYKTMAACVWFGVYMITGSLTRLPFFMHWLTEKFISHTFSLNMKSRQTLTQQHNLLPICKFFRSHGNQFHGYFFYEPWRSLTLAFFFLFFFFFFFIFLK